MSMSETFIAICGVLVIVAMGWMAWHEVSTDRDCREVCSPLQSKVIDQGCFCSTGTGWEPPQ